jgi:hypothetical protein
MPAVLLCLSLLLGFTDSSLGYTLDPPPGYSKGHYEDSEGAAWTAPDGMTELRILVLPIMPGEDAQKTIEELVNQLMLHELSRAYFNEEQLKAAQAKSGMWVDVEAGAGAKRMRGLLCMMAGSGRLIMAIAIAPILEWEAREEELKTSLETLKFIGSGGQSALK